MSAAIESPPARAERRERNALAAAALTNGPGELIDFLLPLWAGLVLDATATEVGILLALELAVSLVARPLAGVLADTRERRTVAAVGALLTRPRASATPPRARSRPRASRRPSAARAERCCGWRSARSSASGWRWTMPSSRG